jgi:integrase/recombinase XerD
VTTTRHDRRRDRKKRLETLVGVEPGSLGWHVLDWGRYLTARNYSPWSVDARQHHLRYFLVWCNDRGLTRPDEITVAVMERYQRSVAHSRKENGMPLSFRSQRDRLATIRRFFRWMAKTRVIEMSPCETLDMPRIEKRLPKAILSVDEVETIMAVPDVTTAMGVRDRAILETFYSTGVRRQEMCNIKLHEVDLERGTLIVRQGKGKKDRMIPIGSRAVSWIRKYLDEVRPYLVREPDDGTLFLTRLCAPFSGQQIADMVRDHVIRSGINKEGSCHLFRHTMATLMLEGGADIRFIQAMLGHASILSTEIYTQVAIRKLKEVYELTHPGAKLERRADRERGDDEARDELLSFLAAEAADEEREVTRPTPPAKARRPGSGWFLR